MRATRSRSTGATSSCTPAPDPSCAPRGSWDGSFLPTCASGVRAGSSGRRWRSSTATWPWVEFSDVAGLPQRGRYLGGQEGGGVVCVALLRRHPLPFAVHDEQRGQPQRRAQVLARDAPVAVV